MLDSNTLRAVHSDLRATAGKLVSNASEFRSGANKYLTFIESLKTEANLEGDTQKVLLGTAQEMYNILLKISDNVENSGISMNNFSVRAANTDSEGASAINKTVNL